MNNRFAKQFVVWVDYIIPVPLFIVMFLLWYKSSESLHLALFVLLFPTLYGYLMPGIGTNVLKMWRFKGKLRVGNFYLHHGLLYSPYMSLFLYVCWGEIDSDPLSIRQALAIIVATGALQSMLSCQHDLLAIKAGSLTIFNTPFFERRTPEEVVNYFSPIGFFLIGAGYAAVCIYAYGMIVIDGITGIKELSITVIAGLALLFALPSVPYGYLERHVLLKGWKRRTRS